MAFKFEEAEVAATLTENQQYLSRVELRIKGLGTSLELDGIQFTQKMHDVEVKRLKAAMKDIKSKMSKKELAEYKSKTAGKSEAQLRKDRADAEKEMDSNKDKPSI